MNKLLMVGAIVAVAIAVLVWPARAVLSGQARDVLVVAEHDPATRNVNEATFDPEGLTPDELRREVVAIYGVPLSQESVLFVDERKMIRPKQLPSLTLLLKSQDENPLKMDTIDWATPKVSIGAALTGVLLWTILRWRRRRPSNPQSSSTGGSSGA